MKSLLLNADDKFIKTLRQRGREKIFHENEEIFAEGETANALPIVLTGKVKMVRFLTPGKEVIISVFGEGEMFAVPPVFDGAPYPATTIAIEESRLLLISRQDFLQLLKESTDFSFAVIGWMCEMLREKTATIQNLATASPEFRVGNVLLRLAEKEDSGSSKISLRRQDIAEMAGLTTETTIRVIRKLAEKNLVVINRGKIILDSPELLRDYLNR
jgi:CRP/FNR family transcriptional regulator